MQSSTIRQLTLAILFVLVSVGAALLWRRAVPAIAAGEFDAAGQFVPPVAALIFAGALFTLHVLFVRHPAMLWMALGAAVAIPYVFARPDAIALGAFGLSIGLVAFGAYRMRREEQTALHFAFSKIAKLGLHLYLTAFALTVSIFFLNALDEERAIAFFLPRPVLSWALDQASGQLQSFGGPTLRLGPDVTVDDFLRALALRELGQEGTEKVSESQMETLVAAARKDLGERYGASLRGNERVSDAAYRVVAERIRDILGPYQKYVPVASGIAFFLAFKALAYPLYLLALGIGFLLIKFLRAGSILNVEKRTIEVERLTL